MSPPGTPGEPSSGLTTTRPFAMSATPAAAIAAPAFPTGSYRTILIDPPWAYEQKLGRADQGDTTRGGLPYESMSYEELAALPMGALAAENCQLWLWATNTHLHDALHLVEAWGFTYKTTATWAKNRFGLGYWLRGQTEHLILAVRGSPRERFNGPNGATGKACSTLIVAPLSKHSKKPLKAYQLIEEMSSEPRIELFARNRRTGWTSWGNEVGDEVLGGPLDAVESP